MKGERAEPALPELGVAPQAGERKAGAVIRYLEAEPVAGECQAQAEVARRAVSNGVRCRLADHLLDIVAEAGRDQQLPASFGLAAPGQLDGDAPAPAGPLGERFEMTVEIDPDQASGRLAQIVDDGADVALLPGELGLEILEAPADCLGIVQACLGGSQLERDPGEKLERAVMEIAGEGKPARGAPFEIALEFS